MTRRRGWCPSLHDPMASGDGWLVRVKPPAGVLTTPQLRHLAQVTQDLGNGVVEVTARGNLQMRGFTPDSARIFARQMVQIGLAVADATAEQRRMILLPPLPSPHSLALTARLEHLLMPTPDLKGLPGKWGFVIDGGERPHLGPVRADLRLVHQDTGWIMMLDGAPDRALACGTDPAHDAVQLCRHIAHHWPGTRSRDLPASVLDDLLAQARVAPALPAASSTIGWLGGGFGAGLPFGVTQATTFMALAKLAAQYGNGTLRVSAQRSVILPGTPKPEHPHHQTCAQALAMAGLIITPTDPRLRVHACVGQAGCGSASVPARQDADLLANALAELGSFSEHHTFHVAGCAKGCAHPAPATFTLTGQDGRYALVLEGCASDTARFSDLSLQEAIAFLPKLRQEARS